MFHPESIQFSNLIEQDWFLWTVQDCQLESSERNFQFATAKLYHDITFG
jgi:hypothetical protein